jgi:hypothetical protein
MSDPERKEIRHINDRSITSQLRPLHGKLRFFAERPVLSRENATVAGRAAACM